MESGVLPANLHFTAPNPNIPSLVDGRLKVVTEATPWSGGLVGLNSFGFGGSNVHAVFKYYVRKNYQHSKNEALTSAPLISLDKT